MHNLIKFYFMFGLRHGDILMLLSKTSWGCREGLSQYLGLLCHGSHAVSLVSWDGMFVFEVVNVQREWGEGSDHCRRRSEGGGQGHTDHVVTDYE